MDRRLVVLGSSGAWPGAGHACSGYVLEHRGFRLVLDLGNGALGPLQRHIDLADLDSVFVSHLHPDHCVDICGLYVTRKYRPGGAVPGQLDVHAPTGASDRFALMYHGLENMGMSAEFAVHELAGAATTLLTARLPDPTGYGRVVRSGGSVAAVIEQAGHGELVLQLRNADLT